MRKVHLKSLSSTVFLLGFTACDAGHDSASDSTEPLSDYNALFEGVPRNDELPIPKGIKADELPGEFEIIAFQTPVKSQGRRGVCSIFSTIGLMEHLYLRAGYREPDFSEQYLQWSVKFELGTFPNTSGSNAGYNLQAINRFGIPAEEAWPYEVDEWGIGDDPECDGEDDQPTRCYTNGEPPQEALDAETFTLPPGRWINSSPISIKNHIQSTNTAVVVGFDFFYQAWNHRLSSLPTNDANFAEGIVMYPNDEDIAASYEQRAGHSILLVGWDDEFSAPKLDADGNEILDDNGQPVVETGFYIFKNSWGTDRFGSENPYGAGYGYISMDYIERYGSARVSDLPALQDPGDGGSDPDGPFGGDQFTSSDVVEIPDADPTGATSVIEVPPGEPVGMVRVDVEIEHSYRGDLSVELAYGAKSVTLHDQMGGSQDNLSLAIDVSDFEGESRAGEWTLKVVDHAAQDVGRLVSWSITL